MGREPRGAGGSARNALPARRGDRLAPRSAAVRRGQRHLAAGRVPDTVPPRPAPRLGDGRTHPRARSAYVLSGPRGHNGSPTSPGPGGGVVDDVPDPAARCGRPTVSGRAQIIVRVRPRARTERLEWDGSTLQMSVREPPADGRANAAVIRAVARWAGVAPSGGDCLGRGRTGQAGRHRASGRAPQRSDRLSAEPRLRYAHARIVIREPEAALAAGTWALADGSAG
jgi:hypothetical protein